MNLHQKFICGNDIDTLTCMWKAKENTCKTFRDIRLHKPLVRNKKKYVDVIRCCELSYFFYSDTQKFIDKPRKYMNAGVMFACTCFTDDIRTKRAQDDPPLY